MAKKRGRKSKRQYFTEDTEHAILEYLASEDQVERNRIYNSRIHHSFYKLAENIIKMEKLSSLKRKKLGLNGRMYYENHFAPELLVKTLITHVTEAKYERQTT